MDRSIYSRPDKPTFKRVVKRERFQIGTSSAFDEIKACDFTVDSSTECHVTPPNIALRMFDYALDYGADVGGMWGDPQCGTGNLVQAMLDRGVPCENVVAIERHLKLASYTASRFNNLVDVKAECFLEFDKTSKVDVVLTNPPFSTVKKHMNATLDWLAPNGIIIALVPITYSHPGMITLEELPKGTFVTANVMTKIIAII
ncbi:hypothetical protein ACPF3S_003196 [Vibrio cholerae]|uniref:Methyltransferase type 11 n=1 Tax=Vibrio cholerae TaxID=666 RepID=A0A7Z7YDM5_VIBCL|nr:methyltransferase type 11 [Vibrio cholerae]ELH0870629.1 hypothetical protein [Vibrio cholerae]EMA3788871.1 hypothetical protein [Vibrio cholerae]TBM41313.1 methyltransferase type 11 [Vibrio cholerae]HAS5006261.1 methyltransferase type 11 [Vibrio cholerae]HAS5424199.1 methyltransferase type 11 [Vibrio cholerae]